MRFHPQRIDGVSVVELTKLEDGRGFFARSFCEEEFAEAGLPFRVHQMNLSFNEAAFTLRGMHFQADPVPDPKIVRCLSGRIFDVAVDLREDSSTYLQWVGVELSAANGLSMVVPGGCAHGFLTLSEGCMLLYAMGAPYKADLASGVRWDDPAFAIDWPATPEHLNERDANYPDYVALA